MKNFLTMAALAALLAVGSVQVRADSLAGGFTLGTGIPPDDFTVRNQCCHLELGRDGRSDDSPQPHRYGRDQRVRCRRQVSVSTALQRH